MVLRIWFHREIPHFSTFGKNYVRRFQGTDLFEQIFYRILEEAMNKGLVVQTRCFIDSTHVKASANKKKYDKKMVRIETSYQAQLELEINQDRENHGKKPFPPKEKEEAKEIKVSKTDPDSGYYVKDEREKMFAYSFHTACDAKGFVLATKVTGANIHDSQVFGQLLEQVIEKVKSLAVAADAGYKTPANTKILVGQRNSSRYAIYKTKNKRRFL